jgi:hypothetical protein
MQLVSCSLTEAGVHCALPPAGQSAAACTATDRVHHLIVIEDIVHEMLLRRLQCALVSQLQCLSGRPTLAVETGIDTHLL